MDNELFHLMRGQGNGEPPLSPESARLSEISFPSHVSELESFSEFDRTTFSSVVEEALSTKDVKANDCPLKLDDLSRISEGFEDIQREKLFGTPTLVARSRSRQDDTLADEAFSSQEYLNGHLEDSGDDFGAKGPLPSDLNESSLSLINTDSFKDNLNTTSDGVLDLKSPNSGGERMVEQFLRHDAAIKEFSLRFPNPTTGSTERLLEDESPVLNDTGTKHGLTGQGNKERNLQNTDFETRWTDEVPLIPSGQRDFNIAIEHQQRPGLDGSSSDSDDDQNPFTRTRINTMQQRNLIPPNRTESDGDTESIPEVRQLAEGQDVFPYVPYVPGDGGGGGDGSSGHSDSDMDGDGGVAIRATRPRSQLGASFSSTDSQPAPTTTGSQSQREQLHFPQGQQGREPPERERPVGGSAPFRTLPAGSGQGRVQFTAAPNGRSGSPSLSVQSLPDADNTENANTFERLDLDSSQDSRLSDRFLMTSSTPFVARDRFSSVQQQNWINDVSSFRTPQISPLETDNERTLVGESLTGLTPTNPHETSRKEAVGENLEQNKTFTPSSCGQFVKDSSARQKDNVDKLEDDDSLGTHVGNVSGFPPTNPFSSSYVSRNPFDDEDSMNLGYNPFDDSTGGAKFEDFSGPAVGDSEFQINSQDAEALFNDDEKNFERTNSISKVAELSNLSQWSLTEDSQKITRPSMIKVFGDDNGELRCSWYFSQKSEELGGLLPSENKPRPKFDDARVITTPPALSQPPVLYKGEESTSFLPFTPHAEFSKTYVTPTENDKIKFMLEESPDRQDLSVSRGGARPRTSADITHSNGVSYVAVSETVRRSIGKEKEASLVSKPSRSSCESITKESQSTGKSGLIDLKDRGEVRVRELVGEDSVEEVNSGSNYNLADGEHPVQTHEKSNVKSTAVLKDTESRGSVEMEEKLESDLHGNTLDLGLDDFSADAPMRESEAKSLLHNITSGRLSLEGMSGVKISNLAANIAVVTNTDPSLVLKLLISLLETHKEEKPAAKDLERGLSRDERKGISSAYGNSVEDLRGTSRVSANLEPSSSGSMALNSSASFVLATSQQVVSSLATPIANTRHITTSAGSPGSLTRNTIKKPISSVTPLVTSPYNTSKVRDTSIQCFSPESPTDTAVPNSSYERNLRHSSHSTNKVDAAVQYEPPSDGAQPFMVVRPEDSVSRESAFMSRDSGTQCDDELVQQSGQSPGNEYRDNLQDIRNFRDPLSSTSISDGIADGHPAHDIHLSPVQSEGDVEVKRPESVEEQIEKILPRISDIRVRQSEGTFYPVMAANQTIMTDKRSISTNSVRSSGILEYMTPTDPGSGPSFNRFVTLSHPNVRPTPEEQFEQQLVPRAQSAFPVGQYGLSHGYMGSKGKRHPTAPPVTVVVPPEVKFQDVQCVHIVVNKMLTLHNPCSRWVQCELKMMFYSVNGSQVDPADSCAYSIHPKVIVAPHTTEDVKVKFDPKHPGIFIGKLYVYATPVVTDGVELRDDDVVPSIVHIEAIAELPDVEILHEDSQSIDFGEMPGGASRSRPLRIINKGRADVPLRLTISANPTVWPCFMFVNSDMSPWNSPRKLSSGQSAISPPMLEVDIPGRARMSGVLEPKVIWIQFRAPQKQEPEKQENLGPPEEFSARVDVEINRKANSLTVGSVVLKAGVGIARLHAPRSLQAVSMSTVIGQRLSRAVPLRNAGNISLQIELKITAYPELFAVSPDKVLLKPGQDSEVYVHFQSPKALCIESFLLVSIHPDGPQYEMVLRGTATNPDSFRKSREDGPVLLCNKPVLCWAGVPIGRSMQQRLILRNNSTSRDLRLTLEIQAHHSDYQIQNTFGFREGYNGIHEVSLKPQEDLPVHVLFVPSTYGLVSSALIIRSVGGGTKFKIPLHGYGGASNVALADAHKLGDNYWISVGEVALGRRNVVKLVLKNVGTRAAFVKLACYSDISKRQHYSNTHVSIAPNDFILMKNATKQLVIIFQPTDDAIKKYHDKPYTCAYLAIFSGDECLRQLYKRNARRPDQDMGLQEDQLKGLVFDSAFTDEAKVSEDIDYPNVTKWDSFFLSSISRTVVSLIAIPSSAEGQREISRVNTPDIEPAELVPFTPARELQPETDRQNQPVSTDSIVALHRESKGKETWTVMPDHIVLTAPNTVSDKETAKIQLVNFSDKPIGFEFIWPAQTLVITPNKDKIPPRSQIIVFVSTKPSFIKTGGELPWRGSIYVQCDGMQRCVKVQIREDLALDQTPGKNLQLKALDPLNAPATPFEPKISASVKQPLIVSPQTVEFPSTTLDKSQEKIITLKNASMDTVKWYLASIAPPYVKNVNDTGDIFRATYSAFRFSKHSGTLAPSESSLVPVSFQPRDLGLYSQFWDIEVIPGHGNPQKRRTMFGCPIKKEGIDKKLLVGAADDFNSQFLNLFGFSISFSYDGSKQSSKGKVRVELLGQVTSSAFTPPQGQAKKIGKAKPILMPSKDVKEVRKDNIVDSEKTGREETPLMRPAEKSQKKPRGVFVKEDVLEFPPTAEGKSSELRFRLCNDANEAKKVRVSGVKRPFVVHHAKIAVKPKSFVRVPVLFNPTESGVTSKGLLLMTSDQGKNLCVKLSGQCTSKG